MLLSVRDVAGLLNVSENTIHRWIGEKNLPAQYVNGVYHFNRMQLLEWATLHKLDLGPKAFRENGDSPAGSPLRLDDALKAGGILANVPGTDRAGVFRRLVAELPLPDDFDRDNLCEMLLSREAVQSTAVGDGVALPHPRHPVVLGLPRPSVTLAFLERTIEFGARDGKPIHTLFLLLSPTARAHLHLLARLVHGLRDPGFMATVQRRAPASEILAEAGRIEDALAADPAEEGR